MLPKETKRHRPWSFPVGVQFFRLTPKETNPHKVWIAVKCQGWVICPENYITIYLGYISIHDICLDIFKSPKSTLSMLGLEDKIVRASDQIPSLMTQSCWVFFFFIRKY